MIRYKCRSSMRHGSRCSRMISGPTKRQLLQTLFIMPAKRSPGALRDVDECPRLRATGRYEIAKRWYSGIVLAPIALFA